MEIESTLKAVSMLIGIVGGLIAAFKAITEMKHNLAQRKTEHRWKQTAQAKSFIDEIKKDQKASDALQMLDWSGRTYQIKEGVFEEITFDDLIEGLRTSNLSFSAKEAYIRDCFDALYDHFEMIESFIRHEFIVFEDVSAPLEYYMAVIRSKSYHEAFIKEYGYSLALKFISRFGLDSGK